MKRIRIKLSSLLTFMLATVLGVGLFWVSQQVQQLERAQRELGGEIASEREGLRVLDAEWDYLNRPDRIEALASRYLRNMSTVTPDNLLVDARAVPEPQIMQEEDNSPVLVSTVDTKENNKVQKGRVAGPDALPITDKANPEAVDFDGVLKDTAEGDQ